MERQKVVLLRAARNRGAGPFLRQLSVSLRDSLWSKRHLVFRVGPDDVPAAPEGSSDLEYAPIERFEDWPEAFRDRLLAGREDLGWGDPSWFDRGWRVHALERDGVPVSFAWLIGDGDIDFLDLLAPPPEPGHMLIWQVTTLPEQRGQGLYGRLLRAIAADRFAAGVPALYISCRDYNLTSRRTFAAGGFRPVGYVHEPRHFGQRTWRPIPGRR